MIEKNIYTIMQLPIIPEGTQFIINSHYAKEENDILFLYDKKINEWVSTGKTIKAYNTKYVKQANEYNIHEMLKSQIPSWAKNGRTFYIFKDNDDSIVVSYNKPVIKGFLKDGITPKIKCGESHTLKYRWNDCIFLPLLESLGLDEKQYIEVVFDETQIQYEYSFEEFNSKV